MSYSEDRLRKIFKRTDGRCHICRKQLCIGNYGKLSGRGNWEVEHSRPRIKGGSDHLKNLYPACITCNRKKGDDSTRSARSGNGFKAAPLSVSQQEDERKSNATLGGLLGFVAGVALRSNPAGIILAVAIGVVVGFNTDPEPD